MISSVVDDQSRLAAGVAGYFPRHKVTPQQAAELLHRFRSFTCEDVVLAVAECWRQNMDAKAPEWSAVWRILSASRRVTVAGEHAETLRLLYGFTGRAHKAFGDEAMKAHNAKPWTLTQARQWDDALALAAEWGAQHRMGEAERSRKRAAKLPVQEPPELTPRWQQAAAVTYAALAAVEPFGPESAELLTFWRGAIEQQAMRRGAELPGVSGSPF